MKIPRIVILGENSQKVRIPRKLKKYLISDDYQSGGAGGGIFYINLVLIETMI
jgi:hypothetical protein